MSRRLSTLAGWPSLRGDIDGVPGEEDVLEDLPESWKHEHEFFEFTLAQESFEPMSAR